MLMIRLISWAISAWKAKVSTSSPSISISWSGFSVLAIIYSKNRQVYHTHTRSNRIAKDLRLTETSLKDKISRQVSKTSGDRRLPIRSFKLGYVSSEGSRSFQLHVDEIFQKSRACTHEDC